MLALRVAEGFPPLEIMPFGHYSKNYNYAGHAPVSVLTSFEQEIL